MTRALLLLILGSLLTTAVMASAPTGAPPRDAREALAQATDVFLGQVQSVSKDPLGFESQAQVRVLQVFKGTVKAGQTVPVDGRGGPTYPARLFTAGTRYLFYLPASHHADSYLNRVLPEADAKADLQLLRKSRRGTGQPEAATAASGPGA